MAFARVSVPAAPVRRKPKHSREMTNQLLFGEAVEILREKNDLWVKVRSLHDQYEGWMTRNLLEAEDAHMARMENGLITRDLISQVQFKGLPMHLPVASSLAGLENGKGRIGVCEYSYPGKPCLAGGEGSDPGSLEAQALRWLNAPYLWGGRTMLGVDCSGFVQVQFKMMGIKLPRDAWQQAQEGRVIKKLKDGLKGDLAFFDDREEIVHVGILLDSERIIHASGRVRIDAIDKKGILNADTGKRTHSLRAIKRIFGTT